MPSHFYSINELSERDNADPKIKTLLASFGVDNIEPTKQHTLVARNQQKTKILGVLIAEEFQKQTIKITYIYIKPMWRRLSIGNALIQRLEQECQLRGITTIKATFGREGLERWRATQCLHIQESHSDETHPAKAGDNHEPSHPADGDQSSQRMQSARHHPCFGDEPCAPMGTAQRNKPEHGHR